MLAFLHKTFENRGKSSKDEIIAFYRYFSKAFDNVPHSGLL